MSFYPASEVGQFSTELDRVAAEPVPEPIVAELLDALEAEASDDPE